MRVTTIGGATVDILVSGGLRARQAGAKQDVERIVLHCGGGAVNAGLGFTACGARVRVVCATGADLEGRLVRGALAAQGIDVGGLQVVAGVPTGKAVVLVDDAGEATVYAQRGASTMVSLAGGIGLPPEGVLYVSALADSAARELAQALPGGKGQGTRFVLNPGMRQIGAGRASLEPLLRMADLVCLNAIEAVLLARGSVAGTGGDPQPDDVRALVPLLVRRPGQAVLVTLGAAGAVYFDGRPHRGLPARAKLVSSLGAGDAFASSFAFHWASGQPPQAALAAAAEQAARVLGVPAANLAPPLQADPG